MIYIQTIIILIIIILFILLFLLIIYDKETFHNITETHEQTNNSIIISSNKNFEESKNKYVCFYAYYEKDEMYKENLVYFLNNGGILDNIDYYIIINGECTVNIPDLKNIIVIKKQNTGYDFGAWQHAIKKYMKLNYYDYYIFLNSSIRGPIIDDNKIWLDEFLELFITGVDVKMVGTSINIHDSPTILDFSGIDYFNYNPPYTHIQSMFFILNNEGFQYLYDIKFFDDEELLNEKNIFDIILTKEIKISQLILKNNWNINCILSKYRDLDYRIINKNINPYGTDPYFPDAYFGETIKSEEVIFFKINRLNL